MFTFLNFKTRNAMIFYVKSTLEILPLSDVIIFLNIYSIV